MLPVMSSPMQKNNISTEFPCKNCFFSIVTKQFVTDLLVRFIFGYTRHDNDSLADVSHDLDRRVGFVVGGAPGPRYGAGRPALALIAKPEGFRGGLFNYLHVGLGSA